MVFLFAFICGLTDFLFVHYLHNGVFSTLTEVIDFYNTRDDLITPAIPEVNQNVDDAGMIGELGLNAGEIPDLIAFMETMTDQ
jgi:cytochrome c peroxidase